MTLEEFKQLIDQYGPLEESWPQDDWPAAKALLGTDKRAATLWEAMYRVDHGLRHGDPAAEPGDKTVESSIEAVMNRIAED